MSFGKYIIFGALLAVVFVKSIHGVSVDTVQKCRTPSGNVGHCVPILSCDTYYKMGEQQWLTPTGFDAMKKSWCGILNGVETICCEINRIELQSKLQPNSVDDQVSPIKTAKLSIHPNTKLLPLDQCGKRFSNKISNGNLTAPFEFPWMAMLRTISKDKPLVFCGGSLISNRHVLTAAHCLRTSYGLISIHSVVLGEHNINTNPDCIDNNCADPIQEIPVERSIPHPDFVISRAKNDIGLVRLTWNALISDSVLPICIPYTDESKEIDGNKIIISGWGITNTGFSNVLLKAILDITPNTECASIYNHRYYNRYNINDNFMCAYGGASDTCSGDSGGPASLLTSIPRFGPRMFQYGIVTGGAEFCGQNNGIPGLYTRVASYVDWILDNISE